MGKGTTFVCVIAMCMCLTATAVTAREKETSSATKPSSETEPGGEVLKVDSSNEPNSDVQPNLECFCTYDQEESLVNAHIGHKRLKRGDRIMRGQTVTFECRYYGRVLLWKNDFRFFGKATMTCSTCTKWMSNDLPTCNYTRRVEPVIGFVEDLKILPGGIVDMRKGESRRFLCSNSMGPPEWDYSDRQGVSVNKTRDDGRGIVMYVSYLDVKQAEDEHSGRYECFKQSEYGRRFGSAFLNIQVNEALCSVPSDPVNGRVMYTSLEYGAKLQYECNAGFVLKKQLLRTCSEDGSWSNEEPECIDESATLLLSEKPVLSSLATGSCIVPDIQNGGIGRINNRTTTWGMRKKFVKVSSGAEINATEVLFLRCENGFLPAENLGNLESNLLKITCIDGTWSNNLQCYSTSCDGNPPSTPNAIPVIYSRHHGIAIWYTCRSGDLVKVKGNVKCHFGSWIGVPAKCLKSPCFTRHLNYPGLVKPTQEYVESDESLEIRCEHGVRREHSLRTIQCIKGKWNITQNPCTEAAVSCSRFPDSTGLEILYSNNVSVGSIARFSCSPSTRNLVGNSTAVCREDGLWSSPLPSCGDARCSIKDLLISIDENVELDITGVNDDFIPSGSEVTLKCSDSLIMTGNSKALCQNHGKWELGRYQCERGCILDIDPASHLLVQPVKEIYRFGEFVLLSCPPGAEMSDDVERIMCMGGDWSPSLPFCNESKDKTSH